MSDDEGKLHEHVARGLNRLADDVTMDRYGDPHVGFTVLLYPDSPPKVVAITPSGSGATDFARMRFAEDKDAARTGERFFTREELEDAARALRDAEMGLMLARKDQPGSLGLQVVERIAQGYERSRSYAIDTALKKAAVEQARPMKCPSCHSRYTKRGFPQHLRMSRWCGPRVEFDEAGVPVLVEPRRPPVENDR